MVGIAGEWVSGRKKADNCRPFCL